MCDVHGREWIVTAFVNDAPADKGRAVLDQLMIWVAEGDAASTPGSDRAPHERSAPTLNI